jgi:hypothetical protein
VPTVASTPTTPLRDDRHRETRAQRRGRGRRRSVARDHDGRGALAHEELRERERALANVILRLVAVRYVTRVRDVEQRHARQLRADMPEDRQAADAGVEDADRASASGAHRLPSLRGAASRFFDGPRTRPWPLRTLRANIAFAPQRIFVLHVSRESCATSLT